MNARNALTSVFIISPFSQNYFYHNYRNAVNRQLFLSSCHYKNSKNVCVNRGKNLDMYISTVYIRDKFLQEK